MTDYSVYVLFDEEQVFSDCRTTVSCADDEEAIRVAEQWVDLHDVELCRATVLLRDLPPGVSILP